MFTFSSYFHIYLICNSGFQLTNLNIEKPGSKMIDNYFHIVEDEKCLHWKSCTNLWNVISLQGSGIKPPTFLLIKRSLGNSLTSQGPVRSSQCVIVNDTKLLPVTCPGNVLLAAHSLYTSIFVTFHMKH